jgi:hypothetical protein
MDKDGHCDWCQKVRNKINGEGWKTDQQIQQTIQPPPPPSAPAVPNPQQVQGGLPTVNLSGPHYPTVDQAAKTAVNAINPTSIQQNKEYAGRVVQNADGSYSTTGPNPGTTASSNPGTVPDGTKNAARYHTHGGNDPHYDNEHFSPQDKTNARNDHVPSFVGTPSGAIKKFDPVTNHVTTIQTSSPQPE